MHVRHATAAFVSMAALALPLAFAAVPAMAQPAPTAADKETARKLLDDGDAAMVKKDYAGALKFYQGAHAIMNLPVTGWSVAQAQFGLGQYLEARDSALAVTRMPKAGAEPSEFLEARRGAEQMATKLDGMIPSLQVQPSGLPSEVTPDVSIDGATIQSAAALLPRRVNPGMHHVEVKASGFVTGTADIKAQEGSQTITVPITMKPVGSEGTANPDKDKGTEPKVEPGGGKKISILLPIGGAIAGVGLAVGIGTGVAALNSCKTKGCALGWASDVGFIVAAGGAAVGIAGLVLTLTSHEPPAAQTTHTFLAPGGAPTPREPSVTFEPVVGPTYAGLRGTF